MLEYISFTCPLIKYLSYHKTKAEQNTTASSICFPLLPILLTHHFASSALKPFYVLFAQTLTSGRVTQIRNTAHLVTCAFLTIGEAKITRGTLITSKNISPRNTPLISIAETKV